MIVYYVGTGGRKVYVQGTNGKNLIFTTDRDDARVVAGDAVGALITLVYEQVKNPASVCFEPAEGADEGAK